MRISTLKNRDIEIHRHTNTYASIHILDIEGKI